MDKFSVKELRQLCKNKNIKGYSNKKKEDLIKMLNSDIQDIQDIQNIQNIQDIEEKQEKLKMIDLFSGTGAFSYAFEQTGKVNCVFANDMIESSKKIYNDNFKHHNFLLKDINEIDVKDIPSHHILTGGFPCQPFSIAGKQKGFEDERSNVFWKIMKIVDHHKPTFIILENVKNLVSHNDGNTFKIIKDEISKRDYNIFYNVLNTADITGIPQNRERLYIVCIKKTELELNINLKKFNLEFQKIKKVPISSILEPIEHIDSKYYYTEKSSTWNLIKENIKKKNTIYQYRRVYVRENKSLECPTLTANMGTGGHNVPLILDDKGIRKLTPRECFNFQGFPKNYNLPSISDSSLYKLAGNAVSIPVVKLIADRLINLIYNL